MQAHRNFALGAIFAAALVVPTLTDVVSAPVISLSEKSPAAIATAKSSTEVKLSCSMHMLGVRIVDWIERQAEKL